MLYSGVLYADDSLSCSLSRIASDCSCEGVLTSTATASAHWSNCAIATATATATTITRQLSTHMVVLKASSNAVSFSRLSMLAFLYYCLQQGNTRLDRRNGMDHHTRIRCLLRTEYIYSLRYSRAMELLQSLNLNSIGRDNASKSTEYRVILFSSRYRVHSKKDLPRPESTIFNMQKKHNPSELLR